VGYITWEIAFEDRLTRANPTVCFVHAAVSFFSCRFRESITVRGRGGRVILLSLFLMVPVCANAQDDSAHPDQPPDTQQRSQSQQPKTKKGKTAKRPAPPLFPKHSRGMYRNGLGLQVIDATPQSPPLENDDPGVPDKGQYEINFTNSEDFSSRLHAYDFLLVDANYGTLPRIFGHELPTQIKLEVPLSGASEQGEPLKKGIGASAFGLKFNFYNNEHHGASLAFYPQIEFAVPGSHAAEKNLADTGQTLILPILAAKEFEYMTIVANFAVNRPIHDSSRDTTDTLGLGVGRAVSRKTAAMAEIRSDSTFNFQRDRLFVANFGVMRGLRENVILYGNIGHSLLSDDGSGHIYFGFGVKFLLTPSGKH
jgi:hypothetical protein